MKLLTRDTSSYRFMTLGGLLSKRKLLVADTKIPSVLENDYLNLIGSFGIDEENVRRFLLALFKNDLKWTTVEKKHDILLTHGEETLVVECKRYDSTLTYLDEHKGGGKNETAVEELHRNMKRYQAKWGVLTDGVDFRLYYTSETDPNFLEVYLEVSLKDILDSTARWPEEMHILMDILSPNSSIRKLDPTKVDGISEVFVRRTVKILKDNSKSFKTVMKSLAVACLEDMGVRPLHLNIASIKNVVTKEEYNTIFKSIADDDGDFHQSNDYIDAKTVQDLNKLFSDFSSIDFAHVDYEFFGVIYQKFINNGNASHYTNSKLSKEMATYLACRNEKSQRKGRPTFLQDGDFILDPAVGSGQLLRNLLPFYKVFFSGTVKGIDGWRKLASHMMGRDIDGDAIWLSKINLWLASAKKGSPFISLDEFKKVDVINATINRRAGESINDSLEIETGNSVAAIVSNPPWDAFKNDKRRGIKFDAAVVEKIKQSLNLKSRQLNRAQIFTKIIHLIGEENAGMRFSIVLPDSFFVDQNDELRKDVEKSLDFYFSYPRNADPISKIKIFPDVDTTRKFGIVFGRSGNAFQKVSCYPFGGSNGIDLNANLRKIGSCNVFPLFSHYNQAEIVEKWKESKTRDVKWCEGEFHQSNWENTTGRTLSKTGTNYVISGNSFCDPSSPWSNPINKHVYWNRFSKISESDKKLAETGRTIFSDYINNSKKLNSAAYLDESQSCNILNTVLYSAQTEANDWLIYDSAIFSTFIEAYGTSQHMNAWRLSALGLPRPLQESNPLEANIELCAILKLNPRTAMELYDLNSNWLSLKVSKKQWNDAFNNLYLRYSNATQQPRKTNFVELLEKRKTLTSYIIDSLDDDSLGFVKLAKVIYLTDMDRGLGVGTNYIKDAAGPVDNGMLYHSKYGLFPEGKSSDVGIVKKIPLKSGGKTFSKVTPSTKTKEFAQNAKQIFGDQIQEIAKIIKLFKPLDWRRCEAVATVYACWNDLLLSRKEVTDDAIIRDFYKWSDEKSDRFEPDEIVKTIKWMKTKKIVPRGSGKKTADKPNKDIEIPF